MTQLKINPKKLRETAHTFGSATDSLITIIKDLNESVDDLEKEWEGVAKSVFFKEYKDLKKYLDGFSKLTSNIAREMNEMADQFEKLDNEEFDIE